MVEKRSIEELLKDCEEFTKEDYLKEKAELEKLLLEHYNLQPEEIEQAMREHLVPHEKLELVDRWIQNEVFRPYVIGSE